MFIFSSITIRLLFFLSLQIRQMTWIIFSNSIKEQAPNNETLKIEFLLSSFHFSIWVPVKPTIMGA